MPLPLIAPPLINSANPWATTEADLRALYESPFTGAVTTRTSLLNGFAHDDSIHQHTFFDAATHGRSTDPALPLGSLNTLGYSPFPLSTYLDMIFRLSQGKREDVNPWKPFIISVTGSPEDMMTCYQHISELQSRIQNPLCMEVNLSCPNIPDKPPPAYSKALLKEYLQALRMIRQRAQAQVAIGLKTPPYTYHDQFTTLIEALSDMDTACPVDFITAVNTLGSSLVLSDTAGTVAISSASGAGIGGMAGAPLHPLALGNVKTIRTLLDKHDHLRSIDIIGVGGIADRDGRLRMHSVGATVVGVGTALGVEGVAVFEKIMSSSAVLTDGPIGS